MSDPQNLNDFFAKNSKKKQKGKAPPKARSAAAEAADEASKQVAQEPVQAEPAQATAAPVQQEYEDSDDEANNIVVASQEIIERKDLEAKEKSKKDDGDGAAGWGLGSRLGQPAESEETGSSFPTFSSAKGPRSDGMGGSISFGKKPPMFTRKHKGVMDQTDFPDLDAAATGGKGDANKAAGPMMFSNSSAARGPREGPTFGQEENKTGGAPKMPIFKGKAKLNKEVVATTEESGTRMNYDFSRMGMSAATTGKKPEGEGFDGESRHPAAKAGSGNFSDDDDFEVVKAKEKVVRPRFEGEPTFGGGMPSFTRGGGNRDQ